MNVKSESGITIVALVVTMIVMIILATITIRASVGDNGLIKQAEAGTIKASIREVEEALDAKLLLKEKENIKKGDFSDVAIGDLTEVFVGTPVAKTETVGGETVSYKIYTLTLDNLNIKGDYGKGTNTDVFKLRVNEATNKYEVFYVNEDGNEVNKK